MPRYKIIIEYDGTCFSGWQRQANDFSVQQCLEEAIYSFTHENVTVVGAGRTDAGVHAVGQVAHFDLSATSWAPLKLRDALNYFMKTKGACVLNVEEVAPDFHARFSAIARSYRYLIVNRRSPLILEKNRAWHVMTPLNIGAMQIAAQYLVGRHDFQGFRSAHCQSPSSVKTLDLLHIQLMQDHIIAHLKAPSFLHNQVRIIMGTLYLVGLGRLLPDQIPEILLKRDRCATGPTAPAEGLYFLNAEYPLSN